MSTNLPEDFWSARESLAHIRQAAHARCCSADSVLGCVLARLSSVLDHEIRLDAGLGGASANFFTAVVGRSGHGKSESMKLAAELIARPTYLDPLTSVRHVCDGLVVYEGTVQYRDVPLGSGEGLAEAYMDVLGMKVDGTDKDGNQKYKSVRGQGRHNALISIDEGQTLTIQSQRKGATIAPTLRSGWVGAQLGQQNASQETTRIIDAGSYSLGLIAGFQPGASQALLEEVDLGTPQRFHFCAVDDPGVPDEAPSWPGPLNLNLTWPGIIGNTALWLKAIEYADEIRAELRGERLAKVRGRMADQDPLNTHRPLHLMKNAALLAILDGRWSVNAEDWRLANQLWLTSCAVRKALLDHGKAEEAKATEKRLEAAATRAAREELAKEHVADTAGQRKTVRLGSWVARVAQRDGEQTIAELTRKMAGRDREYAEGAIEFAATQGWVMLADDRVIPGGVVPL